MQNFEKVNRVCASNQLIFIQKVALKILNDPHMKPSAQSYPSSPFNNHYCIFERQEILFLSVFSHCFLDPCREVQSSKHLKRGQHGRMMVHDDGHTLTCNRIVCSVPALCVCVIYSHLYHYNTNILLCTNCTNTNTHSYLNINQFYYFYYLH